MRTPEWSREYRGELLGALAVAVATAVTWGAWLGWDREIQVFWPTGEVTGPFVAWQVIGCVLCLIAITVVGALMLPPWIPPIALTVTFTAGWTWWVASTDYGFGLWLGGAPLVFVVMAIGSTLISAVTRAVAKSLSRLSARTRREGLRR
ncbi:hypothetical protein [Cryptosporangium minutisporangium]|uniref:Uncharacterized protein n=1 Tax=Cryptosporangium minutisporangium TaxID=113569 RepID=A0ABP6T1Y7_9ACTN